MATANYGIARGGSSTHTSTEGHRLATSSGYDYEVFLSFSTPDTGNGFADFLYTIMLEMGIRIYGDIEELPVGGVIRPYHLQAINQSKISIPIFSRNYAASGWCLQELVQMVKCQKAWGQKIMPIFFDVAPSEVQHQSGPYEDAFLAHETWNRYAEETVREWRAALSAVGALRGWDLQGMPNRGQGEFGRTIAQMVFNELKKAHLVVSDDLVNINHHVVDIMKMICAQTNETHIIGIHEISGTGNTTIAKIIYNRLLNNFDNCCFLWNIREVSKIKGIEFLQTQLICDILKRTWLNIRNIDEGIQIIRDRLSNKRVLLLLDDVDEKNHMDALVGNRNWFGKGSKVIITSRKKYVINDSEVDYCCEVNGMDPDQSLQVFSRHAFKRDYPLDEYITKSKKAVDIVGGLPLALEAMGSSTHNSTDGHRITTSSGGDYEVFLCFRGPDTREGFADFLCTIMQEMGIRVFKADEELPVGEEIGPHIFQAINQSKISIPIFSRHFASSRWCLNDLVQMVKCEEASRQLIIPIFYDVAPLEVRYQTGGYGHALYEHESRRQCDQKTVCKWRAALKRVSNLNGWDLDDMPNRREGELGRRVAHMVFKQLKKGYQVVPDYLVTVDRHVDEIMGMMDISTSETRIIGIYGIGGIGKTTIAKFIYNCLSNDFEDCCFLSNIREVSKLKGIEFLQIQLICDILKSTRLNIRNIDEGIQIIKDRLSKKRVLLLLDDVDEKNHIDALVGKHDWFGEGSKVIITTRKKDVLNVPEVDYSYEVNCMDLDQSLKLFSMHAFKRDYPLDEYINQSKKAVDIAGGLPLALEAIGTLLSSSEMEMWDVILKNLENAPHPEVLKKLKTSFDALDVEQKHIFLDIACLFIGYDKDIVVHFWDKPGLFPEEAMEVLQNMSLIKIKENNELWMHNQLRNLGREIVRQESHEEINKQSRLWNPKAALDLLMSHEEKEKVEVLRLKFDHEGQSRFTYEGFMGLSELRFLQVDSSKENFRAEERFLWDELPSGVLSTNDFQESLHLLPQLRWLSWHDIPPTFKITIFSMEKVIILDLSRSDIMHNWNGWSHIKVIKNLKVLNMTGCCCLERTPNFSAHPKLERLILRACSKLVEIDKSVCQLKSLVCLDVRYCRRLRRLPNKLGRLAALEELLIDCTLIEEIPSCKAMRNLRIVTASRCPIITLPLSTGELANLECLSLGDCRSLKKLPDSIGNLKSLIELDISGTRIEELPDSIEKLKNLKLVNLTGSSIRKIPDALWKIEMLKK